MADLDYKSIFKLTPIFYHLESAYNDFLLNPDLPCSISSIKHLLELGANPNALYKGMPFLITAFYLMLMAQKKCNLKDAKQIANSQSLFKYLVEREANTDKEIKINLSCKSLCAKRTPLMLAVNDDCLELARLFLEKNEDSSIMEYVGKKGNSALYLAKSSAMCRLLMKYGADRQKAEAKLKEIEKTGGVLPKSKNSALAEVFKKQVAEFRSQLEVQEKQPASVG